MDAFKFDELDIKHSNIAIPIVFANNAKLENYKYVKFYKDGINLIVEMECTCKDGVERKFFYIFDEKDFLQKIISFDGDKSKELFNREIELRRINNGLERSK